VFGGGGGFVGCMLAHAHMLHELCTADRYIAVFPVAAGLAVEQSKVVSVLEIRGQTSADQHGGKSTAAIIFTSLCIF
jgi:hypothetical protein